MLSSIKENQNHKNDEFVHFQKINIFGDLCVGKSSFIKHLDNYNDDNFKIGNIIEKNESEDDILDNPLSIVEQIKRVIIDFNEDRNLYFTLYETNLSDYDFIKYNLDTLLNQTECIIIIWDSSSSETFDNIPNLVSTIEEGIKNFIYRNAPIVVIQNKIDLIEENNKNEEFNKLIEDFKSEHPNVLYQKISLLEKDKIYGLVYELYKKMQISEKDSKSKLNGDDDVINNVKYRKELKDIDIDKNIDIINIINCTLLGNSTVGKTTFIDYLLSKEMKGTLPTIGISKNSFIAQVYDEIIHFKLVDTAGQERYNAVPFSQYKNSDGILLFYDVTNEDSFKKIHNWINNIKSIGEINKNYTLFLIANKIDSCNKRKISKKEGKELADKYNIKYFECSSLKGINVYELFSEITLMAYNKYKENCKESQKSIRINKSKHLKEKKKCC